MKRSKVGGRRSEVGGRRSEVGGRRSKVEGRRSKVEGRRSKVEGRRSKVEGRRGGGRRSKVEGRRSKVGGRRSKVEGRRGGGRRSEVGGRRSEVGGRRSEVGGRRSEFEGRRSEVGEAERRLVSIACGLIATALRRMRYGRRPRRVGFGGVSRRLDATSRLCWCGTRFRRIRGVFHRGDPCVLRIRSGGRRRTGVRREWRGACGSGSCGQEQVGVG
ncbi:MAG: hypothetical protein Q7R22_012460 [Verrucomicrobiota bacterium JB025]|nr:hypothetical protein [Verrucomicrobiota bacterium JB025]